MRAVLALALRTTEFLFYHLLLTLVDRVSRLPREAPMPEAMRLYRENIALKAQVEVLAQHIARIEKKPRHTVGARAAQVFAYFLTRGDEPFQRYYLSASLATLRRWAARFLRRRWTRRGGRPPVDAKVVEIILTLKRECPLWGQRRIQEELRRMGIRISQPTIQRILREHGFSPFPGRKIDFERVRSAAKDAVWAVDFFAVKTTKGVWLQALVVIDLYTRELLELRVHDGWDVDAAWTARVVGSLLRRTKRKPAKLVHDHGPHFLGAFSRALRVLDVEEELTPPGLPSMNCFAERAIWSVRYELLRHVPIENAERLQFYLDEYRMYANADRSHQGLLGRTPADVAGARPLAPVLDLEAVRARRLARRSYAHGLLQSYDLVEGEQPRQAALAPALVPSVAPLGLTGPDGLPLPAAPATARLERVRSPSRSPWPSPWGPTRADGGAHSAGSVSFRLSGAPLRPTSARIPGERRFSGIWLPLGARCR